MWEELQECEDLIKHWSTAEKRKERLQSHMEKLQREIADIAIKLGIPEIEKQMVELGEQAEFLITHDQMIDSALRNMPDHAFLETNV